MPNEISAHGFLTSRLSDHIREMDDGSLVIEDCPIARTGFQEYAVRDLPQERARELGIDTKNPSATIDLYRPASEVFAPEFLASLEGRPITDGHPPGFVTPENFSEYSKGHIQNVRKGSEAMEDGEWPAIADLVISGEPLVSKVRNRQAREVSLGYDYGIRRDGNKIVQCDMVGNHNAIVPKGRAGDLIAIGDSLGESPPDKVQTSAAAPVTRASTINAVSTKKERKPVNNNLLHLLGLGLRAKAADAETDPEELAQAALDVGEFQKPTADKKARDKKRSRDEEEPEEELIAEDEADIEVTRTQDRKARDRKTRDNADIEVTRTQDTHRKKMHDALDKLLNEQGCAEDDEEAEATDADLEELKKLLGEFFTEEEAEPAHQADADPSELEEVLGAGEEPDAEDELEAEPGEELAPSGEAELEADDEDPLEEEEEAVPVGDRARAKDSAVRARAVDSARATLKMLRPAIARCNDSAVKKAFNSAYATVTRSSRASSGGYGQFSRTAQARDVAARQSGGRSRAADKAEDAIKKLNDYYAQRVKEGK